MPIPTWNATESEHVEPYGTSFEALSRSGLRLTAKAKFQTSDLRVLEDEEKWVAARPEVQIVVDSDLLEHETGVQRSELGVDLIARDRELNKFGLLRQWALEDLPSEPTLLDDDLVEFSRSVFLDVVIHVSPLVDRDRGAGVARSRVEVVARKAFKLRFLKQRNKFPKTWKSPDDFEREGLPRDALFWIEWLGEDLNRHPKDTFLVWLNEHHREQLLSFRLGGSSGRVLSLSLSAMVLAEIASAVLASKQEPSEPVGTIQVVSNALGAVSRLDLAGMRLRFEHHHGSSLVRVWCQESVGLNQVMQSLSFVGVSG